MEWVAKGVTSDPHDFNKYYIFKCFTFQILAVEEENKQRAPIENFIPALLSSASSFTYEYIYKENLVSIDFISLLMFVETNILTI